MRDDQSDGRRRVFISHTARDARDHAFAVGLSAALRELGVDTWIAPNDIPAGADWQAEIANAVLVRCTHFMVILSAASTTAKWVLDEIAMAERRQSGDPAFVILPMQVGTLADYPGRSFLESRQKIPFADDPAAVARMVAERIVTPAEEDASQATSAPVARTSYAETRLAADEVRSAVEPSSARREVPDGTRLQRWWSRRVAWLVAATVLVISVAAVGAVLLNTGNAAPGGGIAGPRSPSDSAQLAPFGATFVQFPVTIEGDRVTIVPPLDLQNRFAHLWGVMAPAKACATTVEFDVTTIDPDDSVGFGIGVAPRAEMISDQPWGDSIQYEWVPASLGPEGSYIRPVELPGGAWRRLGDPVRASDLRQGAHHIIVRAVGTELTMVVDGVVATYETPVSCGSLAIRAWGVGMNLTQIEVRSS